MLRSLYFVAVILSAALAQTSASPCLQYSVDQCSANVSPAAKCFVVTGRDCLGGTYSGCTDAANGCTQSITCAKVPDANGGSAFVSFFSSCLPARAVATDLAFCRCNNTAPPTTQQSDNQPSGTVVSACPNGCSQCSYCDTQKGACILYPYAAPDLQCTRTGCPTGFTCDTTNPCATVCSPFCPNGSPVQCTVNPCNTPYPTGCPATARCEPSYCGGCNRKFFDPQTGAQICQEQCTAAECGPAPGAPTITCPDGSTGGNIGVCARRADGTCGWVFKECPNPCNGTMNTGNNVVAPCNIVCPYGFVTQTFTYQASANSIYNYTCPICKCRDPPPCANVVCKQVVCDSVNGIPTQPIIGPDGCCPICPAPCANVRCAAVSCATGYSVGFLPGQCCPTCIPNVTCNNACPPIAACPPGTQLVKKDCCAVCQQIVNCSLVDCANTIQQCQAGYKLVYHDGDCCPRCELKPSCPNIAGLVCGTCPPGTTPVNVDLNCCPVCQPVNYCSTVLCTKPNCTELSWIRRNGSCCPSCPTCRDDPAQLCNPNDDKVCQTPYFTGPNCDQPVPVTQRVTRTIVVKFCRANVTTCDIPDAQTIRVLVLALSAVPDLGISVTVDGAATGGTCCIRFTITIATLVGQGNPDDTKNTITNALMSNPGFTIETTGTSAGSNAQTSNNNSPASVVALSLFLLLAIIALF